MTGKEKWDISRAANIAAKNINGKSVVAERKKLSDPSNTLSFIDKLQSAAGSDGSDAKSEAAIELAGYTKANWATIEKSIIDAVGVETWGKVEKFAKGNGGDTIYIAATVCATVWGSVAIMLLLEAAGITVPWIAIQAIGICVVTVFDAIRIDIPTAADIRADIKAAAIEAKNNPAPADRSGMPDAGFGYGKTDSGSLLTWALVVAALYALKRVIL